ncbi:MAG: efflux transporter periplasmic adaptor subunit, partial [Longimicrobiales bacterium]
VDLVDSSEDWTALGDGYQVDVSIIVWEEEVLHVPSGAVFPVGDDWAVYVVDGNRALLRTVVVGQRNSDRVQITEGLGEGETVVVYPSDAVTDGSRIEQR